MKKIIWLSLVTFVLGTVVACSNGKEEESKVEEDDVILPIEAALTVTETVDVNEKVAMAGVITMGDEKIEDAGVVFEVWEEGKKEESEMIESVNEKDGLYTAETTFDHDGTFHIQIHVDARGQHTMPKAEVIVGDGGHYETGEEGTEQGEHAKGFAMHFMKPETIQVNAEAELLVHLEIDGKPLESVKVRYEIWNPNNEAKHDWVDAEEVAPGEYKATQTFKEKGTFKIQVHVEDDKELHEHEEHEIEVVE